MNPSTAARELAAPTVLLATPVALDGTIVVTTVRVQADNTTRPTATSPRRTTDSSTFGVNAGYCRTGRPIGNVSAAERQLRPRAGSPVRRFVRGTTIDFGAGAFTG